MSKLQYSFSCHLLSVKTGELAAIVETAAAEVDPVKRKVLEAKELATQMWKSFGTELLECAYKPQQGFVSVICQLGLQDLAMLFAPRLHTIETHHKKVSKLTGHTSHLQIVTRVLKLHTMH